MSNRILVVIIIIIIIIFLDKVIVVIIIFSYDGTHHRNYLSWDFSFYLFMDHVNECLMKHTIKNIVNNPF